MEYLTEKTVLNQNNDIVIDYQMAQQFELESNEPKYVNASYLNSQKK